MGLITEVETIIKASKQPFIAVNEAKRALFAGANLRTFHFVVYFPSGKNWLVMCGERTAEARTEMQTWQDVFGDGFVSVYALRRADGIRFVTANNQRLDLAGAEASAPSVSGGSPDNAEPAFAPATCEQLELFTA